MIRINVLIKNIERKKEMIEGMKIWKFTFSDYKLFCYILQKKECNTKSLREFRKFINYEADK